jgi:hypothetical protein
MRHFWNIWAVALLVCASAGAWAQDNSAPPADNPQSSTPQQPVPAYGQESPTPPISENPPLSGLDLPSLEPHAAPLSYLQAGATISESADSNAADALGGASFASVSRGLGSLTLKRLWSNYDLDVGYEGGVGYYSEQGQGPQSLQQLDVSQKMTWKRGQFALRDSFSDLPEGNFGSPYGSLGSADIGALGNSPFSALLGGSMFGTLGLTPRIMNISLADVTENLSPKSAVTALAGYAFTHFYGNDVETGSPFIGASQVSAQGGYNRILTPHTQVAVMYAYQGFDFSYSGLAFHTHVVQLMYGHRISGRMDFLIGAGPQLTRIGIACSILDVFAGNQHCSQAPSGAIVGTIPDSRLGVAGQMRLRYKFPKTSLDLTYQRFETSGSGLFAGAQSDVGRLTVERPVSRVWNVFTDIGISRNGRLQTLTAQQEAGCVPPGTPASGNPKGLPTCPGISANSFIYGFVGGGLHRSFGRTLHGFVSYQFNEISFDHSFCGELTACSRIGNRQVITLGLDWIPRPIRLD